MDKQEQFEKEALPHLDAVYRFALRLTGSPADAEDLVQETFLRAYKSWDHYTPGTAAKSWLFTICRNAFLRQRQQDNRRTQVMQEAAPPETPLFMPAYQDDPEGSFFSGLVDETILAHIDRIPSEFREVVLLSDLEGLSYAEIGDVIGATEALRAYDPSFHVSTTNFDSDGPATATPRPGPGHWRNRDAHRGPQRQRLLRRQRSDQARLADHAA